MNEILKPLRQKIDSLDEQLVTLLVEREKIIHQIIPLKKKYNIPIILQDRIDEIIERVAKQAVAQGGDDCYVPQIYRHIIEVTCDIENNLIDKDEA